MTRSPARLGLLAAIACGFVLGGCVSLVPKSKPADLYRFGQATPPKIPPPTAAAQVGVFRAAGAFQRESAGDRLLTIDGGHVAYVAGVRWVAPAAALWDEAVLAAFDQDPGPARLVSRGEPALADYVLRLDVRNFEAHYDRGSRGAPTVLVRVRAVLVKGTDHGQVTERVFDSRISAGRNRVTAIVPAYDKAVAEVLDQLVQWVNVEVAPKSD